MCPLAKSDWIQRTIPVWPLQPPDAAGYDAHTLYIITLTWSLREIIRPNEYEGGEACLIGAALWTEVGAFRGHGSGAQEKKDWGHLESRIVDSISADLFYRILLILSGNKTPKC